MSARIRLVYPEKDDSLMMEIEQYDETADILRRVVEFWVEKGDPDDYMLVNDGEIIDTGKNVDEAGIVKGDEIILMDKGYADLIGAFIGREAFKIHPDVIDSAERWLQRNIGVDLDRLKIVEIEKSGDQWKIVFEDLGEDNFYTVYMKERLVKRYIPSYVKDKVDQ